MMTSIYVLVSGKPGSVTVRRFYGQAPALRARAALPAGTPVRYLGPAPAGRPLTPRRAVALALAAFAVQAALAVALLLTGTVTPDHAAGSAGLSAGTNSSYCYADMSTWALSLGCEHAP